MNAQHLSHIRPGIAPSPTPWWKSKPPLPREHGAWVMLYASLLIGFVAARTPWILVLLLTLSVSGLFLAREAAGLLIRKRGKAGTSGWLVMYVVLTLVAGLPLLAQADIRSLTQVASLALLLFGVYSVLSTWPSGNGKTKRLDRSQWGEVLGVGALTLTAPAAAVVTNGRFDGLAWCLWVACALFFAGGVLHVKMLLTAAKMKASFKPTDRWRVGRESVAYHLLLAVVVLYIAQHLGGLAGWLTIAAYAPLIGRSLWGAAHLTSQLPPLKRIGVVETLYAVWFTIFFIIAVR